MSEWRVIEGECVAAMAAMEAESVDAVVCDPPYDLTSEVATRRSAFPGRYAGTEGAARGFMGKTWDGTGIAFDPATWEAVARVTKPGGYLLAFGGPRTFHRMAVAIEDAGWIIRDTIAHFAGDDSLARLWETLTDDQRRLLNRALSGGDGPLAWNFGSGFPKSRALLKPSYEPIILARKPGPLRELGIDQCRVAGPVESYATPGNGLVGSGGVYQGGFSGGYAGASEPHPDSIRHHAQGRWPSNTILSHVPPAPDGSGGCRRVGTRRVRGAGWDTAPANHSLPPSGYHGWDERQPRRGYADADGMEEVEVWDCVEGQCPVRLLDEQAGERKSGKMLPTRPKGGRSVYGQDGADGYLTMETYGDTGGASRFFPTFAPDPGDDGGAMTRARYIPKASRREREAGLEGLALYGVADAEEITHRQGIGGLMPVDDQGHDRDRFSVTARNHHPTVKPLALMRWLCRLVTPPVNADGLPGLILDPFCGSGSTGAAACLEGFRFIGIEQDSTYVEIAKRRLIYWSGQDGPLFRSTAD